MLSPEASPEFEALLDYLKHHRGCDLTGYKRSSLMRRFEHRMKSISIDSYQNYLQYLQQHSEEYLVLLNDVLINCTSFFRDPDAWSYLASEVIPKIIAQKQPDEAIRVWSAGCAAGQEIYSLLILLAEILGIEVCLERVQCYATDADEVALQQARKGIYSELEISGISPNLLKKYFEQTQQEYVFHSKLRRTIVFGQHNLEKNAPISKIDLLICRNVLIYFNLEAQASILVRFHFALKNTGFLFLGKSEMLVNRREIFTPVDLKHRLYTKGLHLSIEDHLSINPKSSRKPLIDHPLPIQNYFWQAAFESSPNAQFAVDLNGCLIAANEQANLLFGLTLNDWNRPFQDLEPGKLIAAHTSAKTTANRRVLLKKIEWSTSQETQCFDVAIVPVFNHRKQLSGSTLTFVDKTDCKQLTKKLRSTTADLEKVSEALQKTKLELEAAYQEIQILDQFTRD